MEPPALRPVSLLFRGKPHLRPLASGPSFPSACLRQSFTPFSPKLSCFVLAPSSRHKARQPLTIHHQSHKLNKHPPVTRRSEAQAPPPPESASFLIPGRKNGRPSKSAEPADGWPQYGCVPAAEFPILLCPAFGALYVGLRAPGLSAQRQRIPQPYGTHAEGILRCRHSYSMIAFRNASAASA